MASSSNGRLWLSIAASLGAFLGLGLYTFRVAEGLSYFSTDPKACANCHIMLPQYDSWQKSSHHAVARCVDCHLPHELIPKYIAKAENGYHHSKGFTLQDFHEPILIKVGTVGCASTVGARGRRTPALRALPFERGPRRNRRARRSGTSEPRRKESEP